MNQLRSSLFETSARCAAERFTGETTEPTRGLDLGPGHSVLGHILGLTRRETLDAVRAFERIAAGVGVNFDLAGLLLTLGGWFSNA